MGESKERRASLWMSHGEGKHSIHLLLNRVNVVLREEICLRERVLNKNKEEKYLMISKPSEGGRS